jgi:hypothetical protein
MGLTAGDLPVLWDLNFLLGPKAKEPGGGETDSYVLCEANLQAVSPFPSSALPLVARAARY